MRPYFMGGAAVAVAIGLIAVAGLSAASAQTSCQPLSCNEILVDLPHNLDFNSDAAGIDDKNGIGTGFTYVDPPTNGTGYIPTKLNVDTGAGLLNVSTTSGTSLDSTNSLDNALGVGIDAPSQVTRIETTLNDLPAGTGSFEQAGLWFGNDEDNYVKLMVISTSTGTRIRYQMEVDGQASGEDESDILNLAGHDVTLSLVADPTNRKIEASYKIDGGSAVPLDYMIAPGEFFSFDAARINPAIGTDSFGGIFASDRAGPSLVYQFDRFSVVKERDVVEPPADLTREGIAFQRTSFPIANPTSMTFGPDGRLYVAQLFGTIHALTLNNAKQVIADQPITTLGDRLTLGLTVDPLSTPGNVILWASHSSPSLDAGVPNSGTISRLSGPTFANREDVITGLPRAIANHATNSIHFGPDGRLYIAQGGNTNAGAPPTGGDDEFGAMQEQPLSAALLVADVRNPTFDGSCDNAADIFGPPPCDVEPYATGLRNTYDFVFHSNGSMYGPDNGYGINGTYPPSPTPPCLGMGDPAAWDAVPPGDDPGSQDDVVNRIEQGKYYGHPNPHRDECVYGDGHYQHVDPLPNYAPPLLKLGHNRSADGIIEYASDSGCGALKHDLLISSYSIGDDITRVELSGDGRSVVKSSPLAGGFDEPLPLAQGNDGTIYVGEFTPGKVTALTPVNIGCWTERAPLPTELLDAGSAVLGGKLYVVAGEDDPGDLSSMYIYDPVADTWTRGPDLPGPAVENPAAATLDGKLYVFGGSTSSFSGAVKNAAVYDPATNVWTALTDLPTARGQATAQAIAGKIYLVGGLGSDGVSLPSVDVFDPASGGGGSWSSATPMNNRRSDPGSAVLSGKLFVFGGSQRNADGSYVDRELNSVEGYDPVANTWTDAAPMPTGRRAPSVGTLNGRAQVMGGEVSGTADGTFAANEEYDPATDTWRTLTPMPTPRHGGAAGTIAGVTYVVGGGPGRGTTFSGLNEAFSFGHLPIPPEGEPVATPAQPPAAGQEKHACDGREATIVGDDGANRLVGTPHADVIAGLGGGDKILGKGGRDRLCGGAGDDALHGDAGKDLLFGGKGKDRLFGGRNTDLCRGGGGPDKEQGC